MTQYNIKRPALASVEMVIESASDENLQKWVNDPAADWHQGVLHGLGCSQAVILDSSVSRFGNPDVQGWNLRCKPPVQTV